LFEAQQVEIQLSRVRVATRHLDELLSTNEPNRGELFGRLERVGHPRKHDHAGVQRRNAHGDERGRIAAQREGAILIQACESNEPRQIGDVRSEATADELEESVSSVLCAELVVLRLARRKARQLGVGLGHGRELAPARRGNPDFGVRTMARVAVRKHDDPYRTGVGACGCRDEKG
jgi:hypothetical protein